MEQVEEVIIAHQTGFELRMNAADVLIDAAVQLGGENGEKAVLGETLYSRLGDLLEAIGDLNTALTSFAAAQGAAIGAVPVLAPLAPAYASLAASLTRIPGKLAAAQVALSQHLSTTTKIQ